MCNNHKNWQGCNFDITNCISKKQRKNIWINLKKLNCIHVNLEYQKIKSIYSVYYLTCGV